MHCSGYPTNESESVVTDHFQSQVPYDAQAQQFSLPTTPSKMKSAPSLPDVLQMTPNLL